MIDLHVHIIPALDVGPRDWDEALAMCRAACEDGTEKLVATPHMFDGLFNVKRDDILAGVDELRSRIQAAGIALEVEPGADAHLEPDICERIRAGEVVTVADAGKYMIVELSRDVLPPHLSEVLCSVRLLGVTPIISHAERNVEVQNNPSALTQLIEGGNLVQVTAASVTGEFGERAHACAHELLTRRMAHVVASDAHSMRKRPPGLSRARRVVEEWLSAEEAEDMFVRRPQFILAGERVELPEIVAPRSPEKKKRWLFW